MVDGVAADDLERAGLGQHEERIADAGGAEIDIAAGNGEGNRIR